MGKILGGCLIPMLLFIVALPIMFMMMFGDDDSMKSGSDCGEGTTVSAGGHIFAEDYVVLQGFGLTPFARANMGTLYGSIGHTGIDVQPTRFRDFASEDVGVHTISDGTVISTGSSGIGGNYVLIDMGGGKRAYYGHLKKMLSKAGDKVKKGDKIGIMGNTGTVVYHVHFEVQDTPGRLADKDSSPYLGKDKFNNGDVVRVSDKIDSNIKTSDNKPCNHGNTNDKDLEGNENAEKVYNYFRKQGFSKEATVGIMGNFQRESSMKPDIVEVGNGIGFGLGQWSYERRTKLENYAKEKNKGVKSLSLQLDFTVEEMKKIDFGGKSFEDFKKINDVTEATQLFETYFERAGIVALAERLLHAETFYKKFK